MDILNDLYCRLCGDLKPINQLTNMVVNTDKCQDISSKLTRLNLNVNFNTMLPKTVCFECINSLERAYDFIQSVELAQEAFEDYDCSAFSSNETDEAVPNNDTTDTSNKEDELNIQPEESEVDNEFLVEYNPTIEENEKNSKSKPEKRKTKAKTKLSRPATRRQRKKPKISPNVDLDTWLNYNWLCSFCDKYFQSPSELKVHSMQYHDTCNPYRCFDCRARGLHMDNFVTHVSRHRPVLTLMCYKCSLKCETLKELKAHKATHFDTEYICSGCNTTFSNEEVLDEHMKRFYKNVESSAEVATVNESLMCVICEKTSKSRLTLNRHLLLHTDRKRDYICDTCGDSFYNRKEVIQHQSVHSDARPYKCEVCQYSFKIKSELKKHALIHFGPKPFACEECGKCFRSSKELVVHSVVHKDARPYKCSLCTKSFRFKHLLIQHARVHTGLKPYTCNDCQLTFRNWSNFNKHTKDVHGVDNATRKRTSEGLYALDPETKEVIYPDKEKVMEWKKQILGGMSKGRPKRNDNKNDKSSESEVKSSTEQESQESDG